MKKILGVFFVAALAVAWVVPAHGGWSSRANGKVKYQKTEEQKVDDTIANFKLSDPYMVDLFLQSVGYAVFPTVAKAGMGIGGAYGKGRVYKNGRFIGSVSLTQLTIGFQLGGQAYSEVIFFKDKRALEDFTQGNYEIGAQVSAVAATAGASLDVNYDSGVAIFTLVKGGLMYEASVGGQKFSFTPD